MSEERWAPVPGCEGSYEVSDLGRVRSLPRVVIRSDGRRRSVDGGVLAQHPDSHGRLLVSLPKNGKRRRVRTHRLVLEAFIGPAPCGLVACHNDGNETNNRLDNLRWDSMSENQYDSVAHGTNWGARKTHCPRGHAYEGRNVMTKQVGRGTRRSCRACHNDQKRLQMRERYRARKDARTAEIRNATTEESTDE